MLVQTYSSISSQSLNSQEKIREENIRKPPKSTKISVIEEYCFSSHKVSGAIQNLFQILSEQTKEQKNKLELFYKRT